MRGPTDGRCEASPESRSEAEAIVRDVIQRPLDLRPGARVLHAPAGTDLWREGTLVRSSPNGEEWLVKDRFGRFWVYVTRLRPAET